MLVLLLTINAPPTHCADRYYLRRFLRARQHDLKRAKEMFMVRLAGWHGEEVHLLGVFENCLPSCWRAFGGRVVNRAPSHPPTHHPAAAALQAHLKWRQENDIDTILTDFHFPVGGWCVGRRLVVERVGRWLAAAVAAARELELIHPRICPASPHPCRSVTPSCRCTRRATTRRTRL